MKSNQKYKPLKTPSYLLYLAFMAAFALAALFFRQYLLAAAEGGITLILAIVALVMKRKKAKQLTEEALQIAKRREVKGRGERQRYTQLNAEFQKIARRNKKVFFFLLLYNIVLVTMQRYRGKQ